MQELLKKNSKKFKPSSVRVTKILMRMYFED